MSRLVKWIGGIYHTRVHVGDPGKDLPFTVVEYDKQRHAFDIIKANLLSPDAFTFDPAFIQKLQIDERFFEFEYRSELIKAMNEGRFRFDFSLPYYLQMFYQRILTTLYDPMRLQRIQDNELRTEGEKLQLSDYLDELYTAIWQELSEGKPVGTYRRILQREYLNKVTNFLLNPPPPTSHDVIAVCRYQIKELDKGIKDYLSRYPNSDLMTRAHLESCSDIIAETLKAVYSKTAK